MTRVLHVVNDGQIGGGQLIAATLIERLEPAGYEGVVVSPSRGPFTELLERRGVPVWIVDVSRLHRATGLVRLVRLIRRERIGLVHTHGALVSSVLARVAARLARVPVISHAHTVNTFRRNRAAAALYRRLDTVTARRCARILAVSDAVRDSLVAQGVPASLVETVHNGYDPPAELPAPAPPPALAGRAFVVCVGRIEPAKGQLDLVEAVAGVPELAVVLAGRKIGDEGARIRRRAAELGAADRVVFLGPVADPSALLAAAVAVVVPSRQEGFGLVALEAMAVARPVVAAAVGGLPEIVVDGETGLLVPPRDIAALRAALVRLAAEHELAARLGAAGLRRLLEHFSTQLMTRHVADAYAAAGARGDVR